MNVNKQHLNQFSQALPKPLNYLIANKNAINSFQMEVLWTGALQINLENNLMWLGFYCFQFLQRQIFTTFDTLSLLNWFFKKARSFWALYFFWSTLKSILFCNALHNVPSVLIFQVFFFKFPQKIQWKKGKGFIASKFLFLFFLGKSQFEFKNRPEKCLQLEIHSTH